MPTVFIDADACPVTREAISIARSQGYSVVVAANTTQNLEKFTRRSGVSALQVGQGRDSADFAIVERLQPGDAVVTQDTGLAAMALGRAALAISPRGRVFHKATIDIELEVRHAEQRHRRSGGRTGGPSPFTDEDREHFEWAFDRLLRERPE
jgi:uncharacterized protein